MHLHEGEEKHIKSMFLAYTSILIYLTNLVTVRHLLEVVNENTADTNSFVSHRARFKLYIFMLSYLKSSHLVVKLNMLGLDFS